jgi:hypothetical protein
VLEITPATNPEPPTDLIMVSSDATHITIAWTEAYNGGNQLKEWRVYWDQGTSEDFVPATPFTVIYPLTSYTKNSEL